MPARIATLQGGPLDGWPVPEIRPGNDWPLYYAWCCENGDEDMAKYWHVVRDKESKHKAIYRFIKGEWEYFRTVKIK